MTQDDFLERLWSDVIDDVPMKELGGLDFAHAARLARYSAVFDWCLRSTKQASRRRPG